MPEVIGEGTFDLGDYAAELAAAPTNSEDERLRVAESEQPDRVGEGRAVVGRMGARRCRARAAAEHGPPPT
jgi:hypothetical protein